jgi:imidazole glycerol-phosphate synthase subunit HisH
MRSVTVIDFGLSNLDSVVRAIEYCGGDPVVSRDAENVAKAGRLVLPGVGAFPEAMRRLRSTGLADAIRSAVIRSERPMLGICLGMQLMAAIGHEHETCEGLGLIDGEVVALKARSPSERIPHMGWNTVQDVGASPLMSGIPPASDFYFVHSYFFQTRRDEDVQARTPSYGAFASIVGRGLSFGTQFHPEKSQTAGFTLLKNFLRM